MIARGQEMSHQGPPGRGQGTGVRCEDNRDRVAWSGRGSWAGRLQGECDGVLDASEGLHSDPSMSLDHSLLRWRRG